MDAMGATLSACVRSLNDLAQGHAGHVGPKVAGEAIGRTCGAASTLTVRGRMSAVCVSQRDAAVASKVDAVSVSLRGTRDACFPLHTQKPSMLQDTGLSGDLTLPVLMSAVSEQFLRELRRMLCQLYRGDPWKA